ncbi:MAG: phospholipase [Sideroxydans sp.]|nr:phospholipase [Sideroxydans sp.]
MKSTLNTLPRHLLCLWLCAAYSPLGHAADDVLQQCAGIRNDSERLKCYDGIAGHADTSPSNMPASTAPASNAATTEENEGFSQLISLPDSKKEKSPPANKRSYLTTAWNLDGLGDPEQPGQINLPRPYRQSYMIVRESSKPNTLPYSPAAGHAATVPAGLDDLEVKFQLSFKGELMHYRTIHFLNFQNFRLWGAYTQQSNWQAFNTRNSSPFRETNYEPELIATFGTGNPEGLKLVNVGLEHQSNGQSLPYSRSWNRLYLQGGWEWGNNLSLLARGWWRIPENAQQNDNPDIQNYIGRADAVLRWEPDNNQVVSLLLRNNLNLGQNRGFMQLDWTTPVQIGKVAKLFVQVTNGFGESLIDYNHRQLTYGMGVALRDW